MFIIGDVGNTQSKFAFYDNKKNKIINLISFNSAGLDKNKKFIRFINKKHITNAKHNLIYFGRGFGVFLGPSRTLLHGSWVNPSNLTTIQKIKKLTLFVSWPS